MVTVTVNYRESCIELLPGETFLGRGLSCRIRFNDPSVSRRHARMVFQDDAVSIENISSTNPIKVNGNSITGRHVLDHQDVVQLGRIWIRIRIAEDDEDDEEETLSSDLGSRTGGALPEATSPPPTKPLGERPSAVLKLQEIEAAQFTALTCPRCHAEVPLDVMECAECGFSWPSSRTRAVTEEIDQQALWGRLNEQGQERRQDVRVPVEVPIIYSSEILTIDALARDLSHGGMFITSEILDEIGTRCLVTVLPDGASAISMAAEVCHVVASETGSAGRPPGFGIKFLSLSPEAQRWLNTELLQDERQRE